VLLISSARFQDHIPPPGHPERPERAHVFDVVASDWLQNGGRVVAPRPATAEELERAHTREHIARIREISGRAAVLDPDTFTSTDSETVALLAAGAAVQAVELSLSDGHPAFALVRPPGHHAERHRAMGFCLYNNVAVAAAAARANGVERVAILDIDVHHGNGTQHIFYDDPAVLYISTHQFPFYPGTGAAEETGSGPGRGFTVNVPLDAGATDADYALVHREIIMPVLEQFQPQLTIVSAGFDAHERDPLASMRMTTKGYADVMRSLAAAAARQESAFVAVTEGGYDLTALTGCLQGSIAAMDEVARGENKREVTTHPGTGRAERAIAAVRAAQKPYWRGL
jgi:acetoin utilization deacetylase AcuC-like enzyme